MRLKLAVAMTALVLVSASAGWYTSANYDMAQDVLAGGGNGASSANYELLSTAGQPSPVGTGSSANYQIEHGFWHPAPAVGPGLPGDVNGDGCVNVADMLMVRNNLGESGSGISPPGADVNDDGLVNIADLLLVRNRLGDGPNCP